MNFDETIAAKYKLLNKLFYENFDKSYFFDKASYLFSLLANMEEFDKLQNREMVFGKIKATGEPFTETSKQLLERQLKTEITLTYFHAVETLFRLIVSNLKDTYCPWEELTLLTNFHAFKSDVEKLAKGKSINPRFKTYDEMLTYVFFDHKPESIETDRWEKSLSNIKDYIYHFASELLDYKAYNSYKHGLTIFPSKLKSIKVADVISANFEEMILFLEYKKEKDSNGNETKRLYQSHTTLLWEQRFGLITVIDKLINNIINIGEQRYLNKGENVKLYLFDNLSLIDILKASGQAGLQTNTLSISI